MAIFGKRKGIGSAAQDNFIGPNDVTGVTATDVGTARPYNNGAIDISWTAPATGNTPTGYKIYNGASLLATVAYGTNSARVENLSSNTAYTLTVKAYDNYNESSGTAMPSAVTVTTVPDAPASVVGTNQGSGRAYNNGQFSVSWVSPATGGKSITTYTVTPNATVSAATSASSPLVMTGFASETNYTFTVTATNANGTSVASTASQQTLCTTVPATPVLNTVTSVANQATDVVSWTAPASGGSTITNYHWTSSDGKSGDTTSTSVNVAQEAGSAQYYNVYATNVNGNSATSSNSNTFTSFSFTPFGFTPFGFTPFGFTPFGFTPFGFTPFGFTPFGFTPFGFTPFGFTPFGFTPVKSIGADTLVWSKNPEGLVLAHNLSVGDVLYSAAIDGLPTDFDASNQEFFNTWTALEPGVDTGYETTITSIAASIAPKSYIINGNKYTNTHWIFVKRDGVARFASADTILDTDMVWSPTFKDWQPVIENRLSEGQELVITINCEPYDVFFTDNALVFDAQSLEPTTPGVITQSDQSIAQSLEAIYQQWKASQEGTNPPA